MDQAGVTKVLADARHLFSMVIDPGFLAYLPNPIAAILRGDGGKVVGELERALREGLDPIPMPCAHPRVFSISGQCNDLCFWSHPSGRRQEDGYVPNGLGLGGGDDLDLEICLDCHQLIGVDWDAIERLGGGS